MANNIIEAELIYLSENKQYVIALKVLEGITVEKFIESSGILNLCVEINFSRDQVGIYGMQVDLETIVHAGDRVEIYRPLQWDPKHARRLRAAKQET